MSYVLTDDDFGQLFIVKNQLGFMSTLLSTAKTVQCDAEELDSMLCALREPIEKVLDIVEARHVCARNSDELKPHEWAQIINLVSGRSSMAVCDIVALDEKLSKRVECDPYTEVIFSVWRSVITSEGKNRMMTTDNDMGGFHVQFDRPTPPKLPPATPQSILDTWGAKNAEDLVNRMVASCNGEDPNATPETTQSTKPKRRKREPLAA